MQVMQKLTEILLKKYHGKAYTYFRSGKWKSGNLDYGREARGGYSTRKQEMPIIAMTVNAFTEDRLRAKKTGMDEHMAKSVDAK